jgi:hypothetical protein
MIEANIVKTKSILLHLRPDGILHAKTLPDVTQNTQDAIDNINVVIELVRGKRVPLFMDIRDTAPISKGAREVYADESVATYVSAQAFLAHSHFSKIAGNIYLRGAKPHFPVKMFTCRLQLLEWLRGFL